MKTRYCALFLLSTLVLGSYIRFTGLTRGVSDFVPNQSVSSGLQTTFYHFHPDEKTLVRAALALDNPFQPPLTAYGMLPLYLLRGVLELSSLVLAWDPQNLDAPETARLVYGSARVLSALFSCLTLYLVWLLVRSYCGAVAGCMALFLVATAPIAVQQAHFFTVDGIFTLLSLATFYVLSRSLDSNRPRSFALAGLLIGATGAVRLNGLLLGLVLSVGCLVKSRGMKGLLTPHLWLAGGTAMLTLLLLQPFLLTDPGLLWQARSTDDLAFSLAIARGELLRPWTLVDLHTIPYLHYWTHLWPQAVGWPLTCVFVLSVGWALWQRRLGLVLLWCGLYFAQVGGLHTKHVRYLLPLLPFMCLLSADMCARLLQSRLRWVGYGMSVVALLYTGAYGLAFARLYTREDSRIQAGRWMADHIPPGSRIGIERGGFSLQSMIGQQRHRATVLNTTVLFEARGYMTCGAALVYLRGRLHLDYIAIVDMNRLRQFTAAPDLFPAAAEFYRRLLNEEMGFDLVRRFKHYPSLGGVEFRDDDAEPSFIGYDHPAVLIFKRRDQAAVDRALKDWRQSLDADSRCVDRLLQQTVVGLKGGDLERAQTILQTTVGQYPHVEIARLLQNVVRRRRGGTAEYEYRPGYIAPWASSMSLTELGLPKLAVYMLQRTGKDPHYSSGDEQSRTHAYVLLANFMYRSNYMESARAIYQLSTEIRPNLAAYNRLAYMAYRSGQYGLASENWEHSLQVDERQASIHSNLGQVAVQYLRNYDRALYHLERAVQLDPQLRDELAGWIEDVKKEN